MFGWNVNWFSICRPFIYTFPVSSTCMLHCCTNSLPSTVCMYWMCVGLWERHDVPSIHIPPPGMVGGWLVGGRHNRELHLHCWAEGEGSISLNCCPFIWVHWERWWCCPDWYGELSVKTSLAGTSWMHVCIYLHETQCGHNSHWVSQRAVVYNIM